MVGTAVPAAGAVMVIPSYTTFAASMPGGSKATVSLSHRYTLVGPCADSELSRRAASRAMLPPTGLPAGLHEGTAHTSDTCRMYLQHK